MTRLTTMSVFACAVAILRLYSPLPSFFDKSWQPTEIGVVN